MRQLREGLESWLGVLALLSVSLGVLNLLPIPVLDGGHLVFYAYEAIAGQPLSEKIQVASFKIGIAAFIVPFMFFYNGNLLMQGANLVEVNGEMVFETARWYNVARAGITAVIGVFFLSSSVQGWFLGGRSAWFIRGLLIDHARQRNPLKRALKPPRPPLRARV